MEVNVPGAVAAAILAAQVAQVGFEARLLSKVSRLEARLDTWRDIAADSDEVEVPFDGAD